MRRRLFVVGLFAAVAAEGSADWLCHKPLLFTTSPWWCHYWVISLCYLRSARNPAVAGALAEPLIG
jgi:hypothetical protein